MLDHHPESPARLQYINAALDAEHWSASLLRREASEICRSDFNRIHPESYVERVQSASPATGIARLDADTSMNPHSLRAARLAAGAVVEAVEEAMGGGAQNAFCAVRPPGHHAESTEAMGFCIFNNIALAAEKALASGAERVAIFDFDVHHGNGTVEIFKDRPEVMVCSSFQYPFYPGRFDDTKAANIVLTPLDEGTQGPAFRAALERDWISAVKRHQPDLILVSAGFDAHRDDPLAGLMLLEDDFLWTAQLLLDFADRYCGKKLVTALEGGYNLEALARSSVAYISALAH